MCDFRQEHVFGATLWPIFTYFIFPTFAGKQNPLFPIFSLFKCAFFNCVISITAWLDWLCGYAPFSNYETAHLLCFVYFYVVHHCIKIPVFFFKVTLWHMVSSYLWSCIVKQWVNEYLLENIYKKSFFVSVHHLALNAPLLAIGWNI